MADIQIPRDLINAARSVLTLDDAQVKQFESALRAMSPVFGRQKVIAAVRERLSMPIPNTEEVVGALLDIELYRTYTELPVKDFLDGLFSSVENIRELNLEPQQLDLLRRRLNDLLSLPPLAIAGKAAGVLSGHDKAFITSRVFTDIRAVFRNEGADAPLNPAAAVLVHMLRITFAHAGDVDEVFIALDNSDLKKLAKTLSRATAKAEALKKLMPSELQYLEPEGD